MWSRNDHQAPSATMDVEHTVDTVCDHLYFPSRGRERRTRPCRRWGLNRRKFCRPSVDPPCLKKLESICTAYLPGIISCFSNGERWCAVTIPDAKSRACCGPQSNRPFHEPRLIREPEPATSSNQLSRTNDGSPGHHLYMEFVPKFLVVCITTADSVSDFEGQQCSHAVAHYPLVPSLDETKSSLKFSADRSGKD